MTNSNLLRSIQLWEYEGGRLLLNSNGSTAVPAREETARNEGTPVRSREQWDSSAHPPREAVAT